MLNRTGAAIASCAIALIVAGLPNGNFFLSTVALLPWMVLASGQYVHQVRIHGAAAVPRRILRVGEVIPVVVSYEVRGPLGSAIVTQPLPDEFELVEGSNTVLRPKGLGPLTGQLQFSLRSRRRGQFTLPPLHAELVPALHLVGTRGADAEDQVTMEFRPDLTRFRRLPGGPMLARQFTPHGDRSRVGMKTTDFRDLREYERRDPPKAINWKATARRASGQGPGRPVLPLVNEFQAEGRRNVWIFLDCGPTMAVGSNVENAFEAGVLAAGSISQFFIDRGFRVGFSPFNTREPMHLYADGGRRQMVRIEQLLHRTEPGEIQGQLGQAIARVRGFIRGGSTWVVVVTRAERLGDEDIADLRRLRNATAARRTGGRMLVISPDPYGMVPVAHDGRQALRIAQRALDEETLAKVRSLGVRLIHWDPRERALHAHLVGGRR